MNILLTFIMATIGSPAPIKCQVPHSDTVFKRSVDLVEQKNAYYNNRARVEEFVSLEEGKGWISIEKYGKTITLELNCTK